MKILVTGVAGQLGSDVIKEANSRGYKLAGTDQAEKNVLLLSCDYYPTDLTDRQSVRNLIIRLKPDAVIHCAAWTAVDAAEEPKNRDAVYDINVNATRYIAEACKSIDCKMMYISTDYVFDGESEEPWDPDETDYKPLNYYGESKLGGEKTMAEVVEKYFIVRTSWVFGKNGNNFVKTMLNVGKNHEEVRVVDDQIGTPTYTPDLARLLVDMIETDKYGYYHASNEGGYISWYDFAYEIYKQAGMNTKVTPVSTEEYGVSLAKRPHNSRLSKVKLSENGFILLPTLQDALERFLKETV